MTSSEDGSIRVWDTWNVLQKTVIKPQLTKPGRIAVTACRYSHDGGLIGAGMFDGTIQLWDVKGESTWPAFWRIPTMVAMPGVDILGLENVPANLKSVLLVFMSKTCTEAYIIQNPGSGSIAWCCSLCLWPHMQMKFYGHQQGSMLP